MSSPYQRNDKDQNKVPTFSSNTDKNVDSDLEALEEIILLILWYGYLNINSIRNKIVQLTDTCKTSPTKLLCIDETKLDSGKNSNKGTIKRL